jgi:hypothetical protein
MKYHHKTMKIIYKIFTFILLFWPLKILWAQQLEDKRLKIELVLQDGKNTTSLIKSLTTSYNRTLVSSEKNDKKKEESSDENTAKPFYLSMDLDRLDLAVLTAFNKNRQGMDLQINITDTYGKMAPRKLEFKSAVMDILTDQVTGDYISSYITVGCMGLVIDGVKIDP